MVKEEENISSGDSKRETLFRFVRSSSVFSGLIQTCSSAFFSSSEFKVKVNSRFPQFLEIPASNSLPEGTKFTIKKTTYIRGSMFKWALPNLFLLPSM